MITQGPVFSNGKDNSNAIFAARTNSHSHQYRAISYFHIWDKQHCPPHTFRWGMSVIPLRIKEEGEMLAFKPRKWIGLGNVADYFLNTHQKTPPLILVPHKVWRHGTKAQLPPTPLPMVLQQYDGTPMISHKNGHYVEFLRIFWHCTFMCASKHVSHESHRNWSHAKPLAVLLIPWICSYMWWRLLIFNGS